jgi:hypothetical protein
MDNKVGAQFYKIDKKLLIFTCVSVNTYIMFKYYKFLNRYIKQINPNYTNHIEHFMCGSCIAGIVLYPWFIWKNYFK